VFLGGGIHRWGNHYYLDGQEVGCHRAPWGGRRLGSGDLGGSKLHRGEKARGVSLAKKKGGIIEGKGNPIVRKEKLHKANPQNFRGTDRSRNGRGGVQLRMY